MTSFLRKLRERIKRSSSPGQQTRRIRSLLEQELGTSISVKMAKLEQFERELLKEARYDDARRLSRYERQVFSQFGEDGMIAEIFRRIGVQTKKFIEIGVGNGLENNTTFLLWQDWSGYWVEGDASQVQAIQKHFKGPLSQGRLKVAQAFVTAENAAGTLHSLEVPTEVDVMSLDIDRNTFDLWAALGHIKARVVVVEYNATLPPDVVWKAVYHPDRWWNGTAYYGASLKALEELGRKQGYSLVGCNLAGVNAFFVRDDLCGGRFCSPYTSENHYEPPRYFLCRRTGHPACFSDDE